MAVNDPTTHRFNELTIERRTQTSFAHLSRIVRMAPGKGPQLDVVARVAEPHQDEGLVNFVRQAEIDRWYGTAKTSGLLFI